MQVILLRRLYMLGRQLEEKEWNRKEKERWNTHGNGNINNGENKKLKWKNCNEKRIISKHIISSSCSFFFPFLLSQSALLSRFDFCLTSNFSFFSFLSFSFFLLLAGNFVLCYQIDSGMRSRKANCVKACSFSRWFFKFNCIFILLFRILLHFFMVEINFLSPKSPYGNPI